MGHIFLIGMPGCGKTTAGRLLAGLKSLDFIDLDLEIVRREGTSIPAIFETGGEAAFRRAETKALREICTRERAVVATGGGVVTIPENVGLMKNHGAVVFLDRAPESIAESVDWAARPLLKGGPEALRALYERRLPLYRACADYTLAVADTPDDTARALARLLKP